MAENNVVSHFNNNLIGSAHRINVACKLQNVVQI
jgi:hypothetical protein